MVSLPFQPFHPGEMIHWYPLNRGLWGPQNQSVRFGEGKISGTFQESKNDFFWNAGQAAESRNRVILYQFVVVIYLIYSVFKIYHKLADLRSRACYWPFNSHWLLHVVTTSFNIQNYYFLPTKRRLCLRFVQIYEQTAVVFLYSIEWFW